MMEPKAVAVEDLNPNHIGSIVEFDEDNDGTIEQWKIAGIRHDPNGYIALFLEHRPRNGWVSFNIEEELLIWS